MEFFKIVVPIVTYDLLESFESYQDFLTYISTNEEIENEVTSEQTLNLLTDQT